MIKQPRQIIAVDIDDVLANSTDTLRKFVNSKRGVSLSPKDYNVKTGIYWGYYEHVWKMHDIDGDGIIDEFHSQYVIDQSHVDPIEGAQEALTVLSQQYSLLALSSGSFNQQQATERWLSNIFGDIFASVSCIDSRKNTQLSKGEACKIAGAEFLIDDNVEHLKHALEFGVHPILFGDYGWQFYNSDSIFTHCRNWNQVLKFFGIKAAPKNIA